MATAFAPRDCYVSDVEAIDRLLLDCDIDQVPSIEFAPDARSVLMTSMPAATVLPIGNIARSINNTVINIATNIVNNIINNLIDELICIPDTDSNDDPIVDTESEPFITEIIEQNNKLIGKTYKMQFDTCGNFIGTAPGDDEEIAELGDCDED